MPFELARVNVARLAAPLADPLLADFMAALDPVNAAADRAPTACWWVPAGQRPSTNDAEEQIRQLRAHGPTPHTFTLRTSYPAPDARHSDQLVQGLDGWFCPA
ncbi:MAG: DUF3291 domain-containing protein [Pseudonocardiaceae bacterium]